MRFLSLGWRSAETRGRFWAYLWWLVRRELDRRYPALEGIILPLQRHAQDLGLQGPLVGELFVGDRVTTKSANHLRSGLAIPEAHPDLL